MELIAGNGKLTKESQQHWIAKAALEYASYGWRVVPLHGVLADGSCTCGHVRFNGAPNACANTKRNRGKHPRLAAWQKAATTDEEVVGGWFDRWPQSNVGVALGEASGIIDIETDNEDGEAFLLKLFDGRIPPTPTFRSGRGVHRLFKWRPDLPPGATVGLVFADKPVGDLKLGNDAKGSQSVFPTSNHWSGSKYQWVLSPEDADGVAEITDLVRDRLFNWNGLDSLDASESKKRSKAEWQEITAPKRDGEGRNGSAASYIGGMLWRLPSLDDTDGMELMFQACAAINAGNLEPLDDAEFRQTFNSILRKEQSRRLTESSEMVMPKNPQAVAEAAGKPSLRVPSGMRLVIVRDDPPIYELYHPRFKNPTQCIHLTAGQLMNFGALQTQALLQADYPLPDDFGKPWRAKGGIREQLVFSAEERQVNAATKLLATAADYLLGKLNNATVDAQGRDAPNQNGKPALMSNGEIWFKWSETWRDGTLGGAVDRDQPKRLAHALKLPKSAQKLWPHRGKKRQRYTVFGKELMEKLEALAEADIEDCAQELREGPDLLP